MAKIKDFWYCPQISENTYNKFHISKPHDLICITFINRSWLPDKYIVIVCQWYICFQGGNTSPQPQRQSQHWHQQQYCLKYWVSPPANVTSVHHFVCDKGKKWSAGFLLKLWQNISAKDKWLTLLVLCHIWGPITRNNVRHQSSWVVWHFEKAIILSS